MDVLYICLLRVELRGPTAGSAGAKGEGREALVPGEWRGLSRGRNLDHVKSPISLFLMYFKTI